MDSADRDYILSMAGVSSRRLFYISNLVSMYDELSDVVEFNKLFLDFSRFATVTLLCNLCILSTTYCVPFMRLNIVLIFAICCPLNIK